MSMDITVKRFKSGRDSTLGLLAVDDRFLCFTCEDEYRAKKVVGETRIPAGRYRLELRSNSPMAKRYAEKFDFHYGMLWLRDVPNFKYVYIHVGNTDNDTDGCVLVGMHAHQTHDGGRVLQSVNAYKKLYALVLSAIDQNDEVWVTIEEDRYE